MRHLTDSLVAPADFLLPRDLVKRLQAHIDHDSTKLPKALDPSAVDLHARITVSQYQALTSCIRQQRPSTRSSSRVMHLPVQSTQMRAFLSSECSSIPWLLNWAPNLPAIYLPQTRLYPHFCFLV